MIRKVLFAFLFGLFCHKIQAGWVITEKTRNSGETHEVFSTIYFQKNVIKTVQGDNVIILDLVKRGITLLDLKENKYWKGSLEEYKKEVRKLLIEKIRQKMNVLPPDQRENYRELYENLLRDMQNPATVFYTEVSSWVEMLDNQKTILANPSRKYKIYMEGFLVEELWISNRIRISEEVDLDRFRLFMNEMSLGSMEPDHRTTPEYLHLLKSGYPMYSREFTAEGEVVTEVIKAERIQIPQSEFQIPANFQFSPLSGFEIF